MTNNLKCPFCGTELIAATRIPYFMCTNNDCEFSWEDMHEQIWQALIDGKKAQDALAGIGKILLLHTNKPTVLTVKGKQQIRRRIASITKG